MSGLGCLKSGSTTWQPCPSHCSPLLQGTGGRTDTRLVHRSARRWHWGVLYVLLVCPLLILLQSAPIQIQFRCCCCLKFYWIFFRLSLFPLSVPYCSCLPCNTDPHLCPPAPPLPPWRGGASYRTSAFQLSWAGVLPSACCPCPHVPCVQHPLVNESPRGGIEVACWSDWFSSPSFSSWFLHVP